MMNTSENQWGSDHFHRDTLIYSLSRMAEVVLEAAFSDEHFCHHLAEWKARWHEDDGPRKDSARQPEQRTSTPLLCMGIDGARVTIVARDTDNEFLVLCTHDAFSTLLAVAYFPHPGRLVASCVVRFDGECSKAVVCAHSLVDQLRLRTQRSTSRVVSDETGLAPTKATQETSSPPEPSLRKLRYNIN